MYLTSSQSNVGIVPPSVVIPAGKDYAIVDFATTTSPGVTTITASAAGLASAQAILDTRTPSGFATHLKVTAAPTNVLAGSSGSLVVQLEDATGAPSRASSDLNVTVSSSSSSLVHPLRAFVVIPAGSDMGLVNFTSSYSLGSATVTASVSSLVAGTANVNVVGPSPYSLSVNAQPNNVVAGGTGRVVVWITGSVGHPARAASNIAITLTSSNLAVATLTQTIVTIPSGSMSVTANFTAGAILGHAIITASAQGLQTGFDTITTYAALQRPAGLKLFFAPNPVFADSSTYKAIVVGVVNATGFPDVATSSVLVNLTSASTGIGTVVGNVVIPRGQEYATAYFKSNYAVGITILTASAQNYVSSQIQVSTFGPTPSSILISPAANSLPANGGTYSALTISLLDSTGSPAVAPGTITISLSSSIPSLASVNPYVVFKAGESSVVTDVKTGISAGVANISASSPGYIASFALFSMLVPAPSRIGLYLGPSITLNSTKGSETQLTVQLQDINGLPAQANLPTSITVTSSNTAVVARPIVLNISPGVDYATAVISTLAPGTTNLTASSPGLGSQSTILRVLNSSSTVTLTPSQTIVPANTTVVITLSATVLGQPVSGAQVKWFTSLGSLTPTAENTTRAGGAVAVLSPSLPGASKVTAEVSSPLFGTINATTYVVFTPVVIPPKPSFADQVKPYVIPIIVIIVAVVAVLAFLFIRRRRKAGTPSSKVTAEEEQPYDELEGPPPPEPESDGVSALFRIDRTRQFAGDPL